MSTEEKKLPQPPAGETKQESKNRIRAMFLGLVIVMLMSSLNQTILAPSLPTIVGELHGCLLYTSPSPRDQRGSRMPSSA